MTPEDILRYHWLSSQAKWHQRYKGKWHRKQAVWFRKQINRLPGLLSWIVSETLRKHSATLVANMTMANPLFSRLKGK